MEHPTQQALEPATSAPPSRELEGLYVYCIGPLVEGGSLGAIGIEGREVLAIECNRFTAAVHSCDAHPYESRDAEVVASWVMAHHRVVNAAWSRYGTVLPLTFNTIIKAQPGGDARANLAEWLESERETLNAKLEALAGRAEYALQLFWEPRLVMKQMARSDPELMRLQEESRAKPRGAAYMHRQRLESLLKRKTEAAVEAECRALHGRLSRWVDDVRIERPRGESGQSQMLMNLSCLVPASQVHDLEAELSSVCEREGFSARLVGPLPPYSFC
ncbi:MAG: GvpL/GvpF family gas vesicle protein [Deltaproteobacteria bacterium]|nr:GvpL/GvpF family gas vesicle protein [Deltaproteobacteria bacterium]